MSKLGKLTGSLVLAFTAAAAAPSFAQAHPYTAHHPQSRADIIQSVMPAVVNIQSMIPKGAIGEDGKPTTADGEATGTGFIIDGKNGYIVTNNHVIQGATKVTVILSDNEAFKGTVIGADKMADLAVVKITTHTVLPRLTFGNSDRMRVGDDVIAIGGPFGLVGTVTTGIISARDRVIDDSPVHNMLQTDASINPGNSGGPLLNYQSQVIGVDTAIFSKVGQSAGIGFAIPANEVKFVAHQLIEHGAVHWGYLGIAMTPTTAADAKAGGLRHAEGIVIQDVSKGGPADRAGLKDGDIVVAVNGKTVQDPRAFASMIDNSLSGSRPRLTLWRDGHRHHLTVTLGERPQPAAPKAPPAQALPPGVVIPNMPGLG